MERREKNFSITPLQCEKTKFRVGKAGPGDPTGGEKAETEGRKQNRRAKGLDEVQKTRGDRREKKKNDLRAEMTRGGKRGERKKTHDGKRKP